MSSSPSLLSWLLFVALSLIWGSSFILMKLGLYGPGGQPLLNPFQVAALRIFCSGLVLLPFAWRALKNIPREQYGLVILSGLLGSFLPAFLFCIAETQIDSGLTGTINAVTPVFALLIGRVLYKNPVSTIKLAGVIVAIAGCVLLLFTRPVGSSQHIGYAGFVLLATFFYGSNVNMVRHRLHHIASLDIASVALVSMALPSLVVLLYTGFFNLPLSRAPYLQAAGAAALLGVAGTALASVIFYMLVKRAGALFGSMVTYGIPFVALMWGAIYGETITLFQLLSLGVILLGVYLANR